MVKKRWQDRAKSRVVNRYGSFNVLRKGISYSPWRYDPYHALLTISWGRFVALITVGYFIANAIFALLYLAGGDGIENARPGNFLDAFFFSVQTMASIGYGAMYPKTVYANFLVTIESIIGLLILTMASGIMFARFSLPKARVIFSRVILITTHNGLPTLMLRVANKRQNWILEAQVRLTIVRNELTKEGSFMRRFYDVPLVRSDSPLFALSWSVMHTIDESSPLYGVTQQKMIEDEMEILVIFTGIDETVSQTIHARHSYIPDETVWNARFVDILTRTSDGKRCIDYSKFHDFVSIKDINY
ncbi:inward rectifier potassium channel protein [Dulcicalothrix desertica PCC 7102]|uniref:Inward rectifier potassium channel protein n=1 Tax=Dulcicalothrix desertica PCC 7102 TaxID=232991 RepID=A0A433VKF1_9CYAN|nr:ion channel [Dulcicalothrix desertica]RUT06561.1 inward rectifier potassium channel protein [Dulcicalothrix desertica PCC 7102]TWH50326.1 inward rectifier potassium channel [Dulcicalothrix desertica PCC 7102]